MLSPPTGCGAAAPGSVSISSVALRKKFETQPIVNDPCATPPANNVPSKYAPGKPAGAGFCSRTIVTVRVPGAAGNVPSNCPVGGWVYTYSCAVSVSWHGPVVRTGDFWMFVTRRYE